MECRACITARATSAARGGPHGRSKPESGLAKVSYRAERSRIAAGEHAISSWHQRALSTTFGSWPHCATFTDSDFPDIIEPGQCFVFFLDDHAPPANGLAGVQRVELMWPVDDDGRVATPEDGVLTIEQLASEVAAAERPTS